MFRLIKLAALALLGYALYEFFQGVSSPAAKQAMAAGGGGGRPNRGGARPGSQPRSEVHLGAANQQFSGPGEGQRVQTVESDGGGVPHVVGRGVVHR